MKNLVKKMDEVNALNNEYQSLVDKSFQLNHEGLSMTSGSEEWVANLKQWKKNHDKQLAVEKNLIRKIKSLMNRMGYQLKQGVTLANCTYIVKDLDSQVKAIEAAMNTLPSWSNIQLKK